MEDETLAAGDSAAALEEEVAQQKREMERLRSERAHLQSDLEAAVAQAGMLQATVDEFQGSRASSEAKIRELEGKLSVLASEKAEEAGRAEAERRVLQAVTARASELEGEVSRLQHDLIAAMSEADEANAEVRGLKESEQRLEDKVKGLEAKVGAEEALKHSIEKLQGEKEVLEKKKEEAEAKLRELEGKMEVLERGLGSVSDEIEKDLGKMKLVVAELEEKVGVYEAKSEKTRELQNGNKSVDDGGYEHKVGTRDGICSLKFPWKIAVASTGAVTVVAAVTCYLHYAKSRSN